jgi:hypothetical protein
MDIQKEQIVQNYFPHFLWWYTLIWLSRIIQIATAFSDTVSRSLQTVTLSEQRLNGERLLVRLPVEQFTVVQVSTVTKVRSAIISGPSSS